MNFLRFFLPAMLMTFPAFAQNLDVAQAVGLIPHKALYNIEMTTQRSASQIVNVAGQMTYEWESDCSSGWTSSHRMDVSYEYADMPKTRIKSDFSTYETFDGKSISFSTERKRDGITYEEVRGRADMEERGGKAVYTIPSDLTHELAPGTMFPMMHTLEALKQMKAGARFFSARVFDGSDDQPPVLINAFLGEAAEDIKVEDTKNLIEAALLKSPARKVRLSFFPADAEEESIPEYEMSIVLHENGVISGMTVEYKDFTVEQKLAALEGSDKACAGPSKVSQ